MTTNREPKPFYHVLVTLENLRDLVAQHNQRAGDETMVVRIWPQGHEHYYRGSLETCGVGPELQIDQDEDDSNGVAMNVVPGDHFDTHEGC